MRPRSVLSAVTAVVLALAACSTDRSPLQSIPPPSVPPPPVAPAGWTTELSLAGSEEAVSMQVTLEQPRLAVHAACAGTGTLFVVVSGSWPGTSEPASAPVAIFPCTEPAEFTRVELDVPSVGDVAASAWVREAFGSLQASSYSFSIEEPSN